MPLMSDARAIEVALADGISHETSEWEKETAAVLRKSRRLADDSPDSDVWKVLATTTLDGISVSALGTRELAADVPDPGLPGQAP